jgi:hypothetical protein
VLLLWLLVMACLGAGCLQAGTRPDADSDLKYPIAALAATLDTDHEPDWISVYACPGPDAGAYYCIRVALSQAHSTQTLLVPRSPNGIRITARDVDGDRLPDILVMSIGDGRPLGIWINDGRGGFQTGDPSTFPARIWHEDPLLYPAPSADEIPLAATIGVQTVFLNPHGLIEPLLLPSQRLILDGIQARRLVNGYDHSGRDPPSL